MADTGRPDLYTPELAEKVLLQISTTDKGLHAICGKNGIPSYSVVRKWIAEDIDGFQNKYARAKEEQMDFLGEEILRISDDDSNDDLVTEKGVFENKEWTNRSKLRVDARKWLMSKLAPKKYGDKLELDNKVSGKLQVEQITGMEVK